MSDDQPHLRITGWDELQHYKDRNPPWVKLHNQLLDSHAWGALPDAAKGHFTGLMMLASRTGNRIPLDLNWIAGRIAAREPLDLGPLVSAGLIELYHADSAVLAQGASTTLAFARSREGEAEGEVDPEGSSLRSSPSEASLDVENSNETWNAQLAPVIRRFAYLGEDPPDGWELGRCLSRCRQLLERGYSVEDLEDGIRGFRFMVERRDEAICDGDGEPFVRPGEQFRVVVFERAEERGSKILGLAAHSWRKRNGALEGWDPPEPTALEDVGVEVI